MAGLPPSLTYLSQLDQLIVKQKKELMESKFKKSPHMETALFHFKGSISRTVTPSNYLSTIIN